MRVPVELIGRAGGHNRVGLAYAFDPAGCFDPDSRFFYTDDDIDCGWRKPEGLARDIARLSSGIDDVRVERVNSLRTMKGNVGSKHNLITFRLNPAAKKDVHVDAERREADAQARAILVLPKTEGFECMLGEMVAGDPKNCFVLARHSYHMK